MPPSPKPQPPKPSPYDGLNGGETEVSNTISKFWKVIEQIVRLINSDPFNPTDDLVSILQQLDLSEKEIKEFIEYVKNHPDEFQNAIDNNPWNQTPIIGWNVNAPPTSDPDDVIITNFNF